MDRQNLRNAILDSGKSKETYVSEGEMNDILKDKKLIRNLKVAQKEIKEGKYKIVH